MKHLLIVTALSQEAKAVKQACKHLTFPELKISYLHTGVGNYALILELTRFLSSHPDIDFLLNLGVCGKTVEQHPDYLHISRVKNLANTKERIIPKLLDIAESTSINCSEVPVYDSEILTENFVDMESYGFALVAQKFALPHAILKVPVDKVGAETTHFDYKKALHLLEKNIPYEELLQKIKIFLEKNTKTVPDLQKYLHHYACTFTETHMLQKQYYAYESLVGDFDSFFEQHKHLAKKQFFQQLTDTINSKKGEYI